MLTSMTGYGYASCAKDDWQVEVTLRCLNSKSLDCTLHVPHILEGRGHELREQLVQELIRGKVSLSVYYKPFSDVESAGNGSEHLPNQLDEALFEKYLKAFGALASAHDLSLSDESLFKTILSQPRVLRPFVQPKEDLVPSSSLLWSLTQEGLAKALTDCKEMQDGEGKKTTDLIFEDLSLLDKGLAMIESTAPHRAQRIEEQVRQRAKEFLHEDLKQERWEQELFFYLERMDFSEEKDRLAQHLSFFRKCFIQEESTKGKRLLFICQEIGRELNTLGIKSHDAAIQQESVEMKSALERIKEQLHNVR